MKYICKTNKTITGNFVKELLLDRGIIRDDEEYLSKFLKPTKSNEINSARLDHMEEGYQLLMNSLRSHAKMYLVVDSDCDGYTSAALFYSYLMDNFKDYEPDIVYHIPEGKEHGLDSIMDWFPEDGTNSLIICPDSSSNDYEQHTILAARGYQILVLDHHITERYSENAVVINNQLSKDYPNKDLSGVGVVYKFFEYVEMRENLPAYSENYIDIVMLGLVGDMINMCSLENRYILKKGLSNIKNDFFLTLMEKQDFSMKGEKTQTSIAFYIVPLINSLIRLGAQSEKERLFQAFITPDLVLPSTKRGHKEGDTENICEQVARICTNTKARQNRERDKALELFDIQIIENCLDENKVIILNADELDIPKTLTGLCAMGVVSKYKKPVLVGRIDNEGMFKGSLRAPSNSPIKDFKAFLNESGYMEYVEGHANAAGQCMKASNIEKLIAYANDKLADVNFNEGYWEVDFIVNGNASYLGNLIDELSNGKEFWGQGCPEPLIAIENVSIDIKDILYRGAEKNTVAFSFNGVEYIKFKDDELVNMFKDYDGKINMTVIGTPQINEWGGRKTRQIQIKAIDIKKVEDYDF